MGIPPLWGGWGGGGAHGGGAWGVWPKACPGVRLSGTRFGTRFFVFLGPPFGALGVAFGALGLSWAVFWDLPGLSFGGLGRLLVSLLAS